MNEELKPCPWCDEIPSIEQKTVICGIHETCHPGTQTVWNILCHRCGATQWNRKTRQEALKAWNKRWGN